MLFVVAAAASGNSASGQQFQNDAGPYNAWQVVLNVSDAICRCSQRDDTIIIMHDYTSRIILYSACAPRSDLESPLRHHARRPTWSGHCRRHSSPHIVPAGRNGSGGKGSGGKGWVAFSGRDEKNSVILID